MTIVAPPYEPGPIYHDLLLILYQHRLSISIEDTGLPGTAEWIAANGDGGEVPLSVALQRADHRSAVAKRMSWLVAFTLVETFFSRRIFDHLEARLPEDLLEGVWPAVDATPIHEKVFVWTRMITGHKIRGNVTDRDLNRLRAIRNAIAHGRHDDIEHRLRQASWLEPLELAKKLLRGFYAAAELAETEQLFDAVEERRLLGAEG